MTLDADMVKVKRFAWRMYLMLVFRRVAAEDVVLQSDATRYRDAWRRS